MAVVNEFHLIEAVHMMPEIWDNNCVQFRNKDTKSKAWQSIAKEVGSTVENCINTWKRLRDRYTRTKPLMPSGSEGGRRVWDKEEIMRFLDKVLVTRKTTSNAPVDETLQDNQINIRNVESQEVLVEDTSYLVLNCEIDENTDVVIQGPSSSTSNGTSTSNDTCESLVPNVLFSPCSESVEENHVQKLSSTPAGSRNKRKAATGNNGEVAASLINAINKLTKDETSENTTEDPVLSSFIKFYGEQMKQLLERKTSAHQRRIINRLIAFMDELFDEYE